MPARHQRAMARDMRRMRRYMRKSTKHQTRGRPHPVSGISRVLWKYRSELAPAYLAVYLAFSAALAHRAWGPLTTIIIGLLVLVTAGVRVRRYDRTPERTYAAGVVVLAGGWWLAAAIIGPDTNPLLGILVIGGFIAALPWWRHHRRRARVRVDRTLAAWPELAENAGLGGSRVMSALVDAYGYTVRVALRRGTSARTAIARADEIASMLGVRPNSVRVTGDPDREDHVIVRVTETDPLARPNPWPGASDAPSITVPVPLGIAEDGTVSTVTLLRRHALIGGVVGSGKSGVVNAILATLGPAEDVALWGIDLKGGMELGPWANCLEKLATAPDDAVDLLAEAFEELQRRARDLSARGERTWHPDRTHKALVILIDEFAELPDQGIAITDSIARLGRAVAVTLIVATQRPTQDVMGNGAVRSQMDVRIALRVRERGDTDLILGAGAYKSGWRTDYFNLPGVYLIYDPEHNTPVPNRAYLVDDATVTRITGGFPTPKALAAADGTKRVADPDDALWTALAAAGPDGASVADLVTATGRSRRWVYYSLRQLQDAGTVHQVAPGRFTTTGPS
ncbi:FtsK/SpoIIIE domain-containing protein [Frankia sp. R82]|uniref:FtsK/SpoIIIE domain-containing protein n=1 Tax=Frankia sp. R82 TaxID=2950553 RepID=UPI002042F688|nr:FtsK/SpoIIIE domain-containing protein [Frankia sp. R82]MCM3882149.1 FtsK/SpoIIIE domain-containing protein [Frankia sp. R82]